MTQTRTLETTIQNSQLSTSKPSIIKKADGHLLQNIDLSIGTCDLFIPTQKFGTLGKKRDFDDWWNYGKDDTTVASFETLYAIMRHISVVKDMTKDIFPELIAQNKSFLWNNAATLTSRIEYDGVFGTIEHKNPDRTVTSVVTPIPEYMALQGQISEYNPARATRLILMHTNSEDSNLAENIAEATKQLLHATFGKHHEQYGPVLRQGVHNLNAEINLHTPAISTRSPDTEYRITISRKAPTAQINIGYEMTAIPDKHAYLVQLVK